MTSFHLVSILRNWSPWRVQYLYPIWVLEINLMEFLDTCEKNEFGFLHIQWKFVNCQPVIDFGNPSKKILAAT